MVGIRKKDFRAGCVPLRLSNRSNTHLSNFVTLGARVPKTTFHIGARAMGYSDMPAKMMSVHCT
jgi:hypothetical protein